MKSRYVLLKYMFMLRPDEGWSHLYEFDATLGKFFKALGYNAEVVKSIDGQNGERILLIQRIDPTLPDMQPQKKEIPLKQVVNSLRDKKRYG